MGVREIVDRNTDWDRDWDRDWNLADLLPVVGVVQSFLLAAFFLRSLFAPGYLLHNDFITPLSFTPSFFSRFVYAWDPVTGAFSYNAPKLTLQAVVALLATIGLSSALIYKLVVVFILGLAGATMFRLLYARTVGFAGPGRAYTAATLGSLLFVANPWVVNKLHHHFWLVLGYALLPVIYGLYTAALDGRDRLPVLLALAVAFAVEATQPHSVFIYVLPLLLITAVVHLLGDLSVGRTVAFVRTNLRIGVVAALVNAFWMVPLGLFYLRTSPTPGGYVMTVGNLQSLSRESTMVRALNLRSGIGMKGLVQGGFAASFETGVVLLDQVWPAVGLGLVAVAVAALLSRSEHCRRERLAFGALAVVSAILLTGTEPPFGDRYLRAALDLPMGWMLRDPYKFGGLFTFSLAGLSGLGVAHVLAALDAVRERSDPLTTATKAVGVDVYVAVVRRRTGRVTVSDGVSVTAVAVLLVAASFHGWPMLTGDVNGHFEPTEVPDGYERTLEDLSALPDDGRVLYLPNDYVSVENPRVFSYRWTDRENRDHVRGNSFLEFSTPGAVMPNTPSNHMLLTWLQGRLQRGELDDPSAVLQGVGVRYVVVHTAVTAETEAPSVLAALRADPDITTVSSYDVTSDGQTYGEIVTLEVRDASRFRAGPAVEAYDVADLAPLYGLDGNASTEDVGESDGAPVAVSFESDPANRSGVVSSGEAAPLYLDVGRQLAPFGHTDRHVPSAQWSKAQPHEPWQGRWHYYLADRGIDTWQTDYDYGFAFTWRGLAVPGGTTLTEDDRIAQWRFPGSRAAPGWESLDREQSMRVTRGHLELSLDESNYGWKRVASPPVDVEPTGVYRFEFDVRGINAHGVHAKVAEYDDDGDLVHVERTAGLGSGNFSRRGVSFDYVPRDPETTAVRLQVWHGHETDQPLPNEVRLDDVRVYDVTRYAEAPAVRIPFTVNESGEYRLFARYLASEGGGRMRVTLDGETVPVETRASFDRLVWDEVTTRELDAGRHTLVLENVYGLNAVNVFTLARAEAVERNADRVARTLANRSVLYLFDGERDLQRRHAETTSVPGEENGTGEALELGAGGRAWREFEVMKPGWYDLSVRGAGTYRLRLDNRTYPFESVETPEERYDRLYVDDGTRRVDVTPVERPAAETAETEYDRVYLERGTHRVEVTPVGRTVEALSFEDGALPDARWGFDVAGSPLAHGGERSLRVSTDRASRGWSEVHTEPTRVSSGRRYVVVAHTRQRNAEGSHVLLQGYDSSREEWRRLARLPTGASGTTDWRTLRAAFEAPTGVERVRFVLNAGGQRDADAGPAVTWFDDVELRTARENAVDEVRLYSAADDDRLGEFVSPRTDGAEVLDYERVNPTRYRVRVDASEPYTLSFGEGYDSLWVAEVHTEGGTERYESFPLYEAVNGFRIDETGEHTVTVRYRPQRWATLGATVSAVSLVGCLGFVVYGRRRRRDGTWGARVRNWLGRRTDALRALRERLRAGRGERKQERER